MSTVTAAGMGHHQYIPLAKLAPSPLNHRKHFDKDRMAELTESIRNHGVIQPIVARPLNGGDNFEVVAGERRFRGAKAAGLVDIPATVRELTDVQVLELQVIENGQRVDVHPLEEAEGYEALMKCPRADGQAYTADAIAEKVGKSRAYVYARLKLTALGKKSREAFYAGALDASRALLLARIPVAELQDQALQEILEEDYEGPMSYREAAQHVQQNYMLQLKSAPFKTGDAELLPKAGACSTCPKRTGNQPELFGDVKSADVCTDPKCFAAKKDAHALKLREAAVARGQEVITGAEAKKIKPQAFGDLKGYRALDETVWVGNKQKSVKQLLGKDCPTPKLLEDPHTGELRQVVAEADVKDLLKAKLPNERSSGNDDWRTQEKARAAKAKREGDFRRRIHEQLRALVTDGVTQAELALIAIAFFEDILHEHRVRIARLWNADGEGTKRNETELFEKTIAKMSAAELPRLLIDLTVVKDTHVGTYDSRKAERLYAIAAGRGIDVEKERLAFNRELKDKAPAKKKRAKK